MTRTFAIAMAAFGAVLLLLSWVVALQNGSVVPVAVGTALGAVASYALIRWLQR